MGIVTITTDFGIIDPYVGVMKGVMLSIDPGLTIVDITNEIEPQNIMQAAYAISASFEYFPKGAVHLCVVDPGVGSERMPIIVEAGGHYFVGPDNGVFTEAIRKHGDAVFRRITNSEKTLTRISSTFHGRDIFAPVAARLARGELAESFGPVIESISMLDLPWETRPSPNTLVGEVIYIDRFGNVVTNLTRSLIEKVRSESGDKSVTILIGEESIEDILPYYSAAYDEDALNAVYGSWDTLEIFLKNGDAALLHGIEIGDDVEARFF
ncbi:MAG: SAM-dependent chlorinase/fluorinase [Nitrospinae bacterium]|nr:SAM-dependent chlorinase/fluorinase [Nitrospinota bacterium]MBF0635163.1 SAM-dependent chlorinase/fluorinase [Nitrospinota bacterium]